MRSPGTAPWQRPLGLGACMWAALSRRSRVALPAGAVTRGSLGAPGEDLKGNVLASGQKTLYAELENRRTPRVDAANVAESLGLGPSPLSGASFISGQGPRAERERGQPLGSSGGTEGLLGSFLRPQQY